MVKKNSYKNLEYFITNIIKRRESVNFFKSLKKKEKCN